MKTRLKELRKKAGYSSAEEFAEKMGMSVHTYRKYEQGVIDLYLDTACDFAEEFGCTVEELLGRAPVDAGRFDALTPSERHLLELYRTASPVARAAIVASAEGILGSLGERAENSGEAVA